MSSLGFKSVKEASKEWGITQRRVVEYCQDGRIPNAQRFGKMWMIPTESTKPLDARSCEFISDTITVKPFVKWAGGKGQILKEIRTIYPAELGNNIKKYAEPFIGGGAVLFDILSNYILEEVYISDINKELINTYLVIKSFPDEIISLLKQYQDEHLSKDEQGRKEYFYQKRDKFNEIKLSSYEGTNIELAALFIYLNKTCFNGLYRVNSKGLFNTPSGVYKNPLICDESNLRNVSKLLQNVTIIHGDYRESIDFIDENTFVYFDPPYRPLTHTASFTAYTEGLFNDENQRELAEYVGKLSEKGAKVAVSNSDPKNTNKFDEFFDKLYEEHNIQRISANRAINSKGDSRGKISELLITNY